MITHFDLDPTRPPPDIVAPAHEPGSIGLPPRKYFAAEGAVTYDNPQHKYGSYLGKKILKNGNYYYEGPGDTRPRSIPIVRQRHCPVSGLRLKPYVLSDAQIKKALRHFRTRRAASLRAMTMTIVLWRTGLRLNEMRTLKDHDLDLAECTCRVVGKGSRLRTIGVDARTCAYISAWMKRRDSEGYKSPEGWLWSGRNGLPISEKSYRKAFSKAMYASGIRHRVNVHSLRHSAAVGMLRERMPMTAIQRQLGHSSLSRTQIYLSSLLPTEVIEEVRKRTWEW